MELIRGLHNIKPYHKGCILAMGNFDGFHRGHQLLINILCEKKKNYKLPIMVMIFEPHPREFFSKIVRIRLSKFRDKIQYLFTAGVDIILCIAFNKKFASTEAYNFVKKILIYKLGVQFICIGNDFRFGACRKGDYKFLKKIGNQEGFQVACIETCVDKLGQKISSTSIKIALMEDRIMDAEFLMGHAYRVFGKVIHGNKLGRIIGFPTANVFLQGKQLPMNGVYAVTVYGVCDLPLPGIANIGIRPTITGSSIQQLEVHIFNISIDLYLRYITVVFLKKIRNEQYFRSIRMLKNQIKNDMLIVCEYFKKYPNIMR
ncbi:riboflavin biosynthesis protein RibF [Candidatus Blochmanniella vafra str. BVAF]|uniref:Riboflavin biosynthesis protein n=1 Tax=Blochmanniella vafra (strain BVAF) TaxID=859654 RepID=E8Q5M8_BLOVB|nr:riboflavin biosynthesis protein RibF [Candidatus Blochmannia vafer str. BVAF]